MLLEEKCATPVEKWKTVDAFCSFFLFCTPLACGKLLWKTLAFMPYVPRCDKISPLESFLGEKTLFSPQMTWGISIGF